MMATLEAMADVSAKAQRPPEPDCSVERCLAVLSDRWSFLIMRDALMAGIERFADFQKSLGIAPNILTARLEHLVDAGVMTKRSYQEPGSRRRQSYHLTPAGRDLAVPFAALQQWGDVHEPHPQGPSVDRRSSSGASLRVGLLDDAGNPVAPADLVFVPTARMSA
jgi:DNA-binding HxlR family transcriptional regulator